VFSFKSAVLPEPLAKAVEKLGYVEATPIQARSIPVILEGKDLIACAQTGSGKTAAYCLPLLMRLLENPSMVALILVPTRELAKQISDVLRELTYFIPGVRTALLIGGVDMQKQLMALKRDPRVIVATPGRLTDHLRRRSTLLTHSHYLVLDEGDRMLDMGFAPQLDVILKYVPEKRQTLLFSATLDPAVRKLAHKYLKSPVQVTVGEESQPVDRIKQTGIQTTHQAKNELLLNELNARQGSVLVFARTQVRTDKVARFLESYGFPVARIHGGRSQGQRNSALQGFRDGKFRILVATDIAARGIDVPQIGHVINYDLPMMDEDYVHRIGRTARAGASGEAISLLTPEDQAQWISLARKYRIQGVDVNARPTHGQGGGRNAGRPQHAGHRGGGRGGGGGRNRPRGRGGRSGSSQRSSHSQGR
jgi:ATP-dependent RNA helicase DeaD